jgi:thiol:disulfide interchange protein
MDSLGSLLGQAIWVVHDLFGSPAYLILCAIYAAAGFAFYRNRISKKVFIIISVLFVTLTAMILAGPLILDAAIHDILNFDYGAH